VKENISGNNINSGHNIIFSDENGEYQSGLTKGFTYNGNLDYFTFGIQYFTVKIG
jgi:hypothetical protein